MKPTIDNSTTFTQMTDIDILFMSKIKFAQILVELNFKNRSKNFANTAKNITAK